MQHRANEKARRARDVRGERASMMRQWFAGPELERLQPEPGQAADTVLGRRIGLPHTGELLEKRSSAGMKIYGRASSIRKERWGTMVTFALDCRGVAPAALRNVFAGLCDTQLRQMQNPELRPAGLLLDPEFGEDGMVDLVAVVTDPLAMTKISTRAYTGCLVSFDDDVISDVSLIDSPAGFMEKGYRPRDGAVICKLYDRKPGMKKSTGPALPASAQAVVTENQRIDALAAGRADPLLVKALYQRNSAAYGVELVKMARHPAAVGDAGLIGFLRGGRP